MKFRLCRNGLHEMTPSNRVVVAESPARRSYQYCRACKRATDRAVKLRRRYPDGVPPLVASRSHLRSQITRAYWAGLSPEERQSRVALAVQAIVAGRKASPRCQPQTWCHKRLHRLVPENVYVYADGKRACLWCARARSRENGANARRIKQASRLRAEMLAAHPDRGGSHEQFLAAHQAYQEAVA